MQQGKPIEFASRLLTTSERNSAQIEKELLSVTYGLQRFDQYTYVRPVIVENDHKVKVKSCYNSLRLGTLIVLVSSGIDSVNTPRLYSDRATR